MGYRRTGQTSGSVLVTGASCRGPRKSRVKANSTKRRSQLEEGNIILEPVVSNRAAPYVQEDSNSLTQDGSWSFDC